MKAKSWKVKKVNNGFFHGEKKYQRMKTSWVKIYISFKLIYSEGMYVL